MEIINLKTKNNIYTSNVYYIRGTWNAIEDVNALVDVGRYPSIIEKMEGISSGVGKNKLDSVVLTHSHYDHASLLPLICESFKPITYAYSSSLANIDCIVKDGDQLKLGDRMFEIIHAPGHSNDSICLYCEQDGVLFAGDTHVLIDITGETYEDGFVYALSKLCRRDIRSIYFGHGPPLLDNCNARIRGSLKNVKASCKQYV